MAYSKGTTKNGKVHFADRDPPNESDTEEYWTETVCGLRETESDFTNEIERVTCKNCLKRLI